jgi:dynein light intermediate chain
MRVRDEIRLTMNAYQTLYESSVAWGMRKALETEQGQTEMEKQVRSCISECTVSSNSQD